MSFIYELEQIIHNRLANPTTDSYTTRLRKRGTPKICQKVGEEAVEVIVAALGQGRSELVAESADLIYHWLVLLADQGISLLDIEAELKSRHGKMSQSHEPVSEE
ncbi:MAG TPA: phosphoribosyl-ATP diphosphatase [Anaerolineales bacterium]|nr:phosphoribosyl-ATP diphosphatase [Anaerolineales bacterium]